LTGKGGEPRALWESGKIYKAGRATGRAKGRPAFL